MKNGVYICENIENLPGIKKKVINQIRAFENEKISMNVISIAYSISDKIKNKTPFLSAKYEDIFRLVPNITDISFIYIRKPSILTKKFVFSLNKIKNENPNIIILLEIPTFPYDYEVKMNFKNIFSIAKDRHWREKLNSVDRIVTYSEDKEIFQCSTIRTSNGVEFDKIPIKKTEFKKNSIDMIGVASISHWHGYDRIIEGLKNYYNQGGKLPINFHIVGDGNPDIINNYRTLIEKYKLSNNVFLHGKLVGKELDEIFDQSDIGIDALGRHRSNIYYNSSLKGKEYLARGLPIVSGVKTELDYMPSTPSYLRVSADDLPVDIFKIRDFYFDTLNKDINQQDIRKFGESYFNYKVTMKPIIDFINNK